MSATSRRNKKKAGKIYSQPKQTVIHDNLPITRRPNPDQTWILGATLRDFPAMADIPDRFKDDKNPFVRKATKWFFGGIHGSELFEKPGINRNAALRHLAALQESFAPRHEHKTAAVAYLMAMWFDISEE